MLVYSSSCKPREEGLEPIFVDFVIVELAVVVIPECIGGRSAHTRIMGIAVGIHILVVLGDFSWTVWEQKVDRLCVRGWCQILKQLPLDLSKEELVADCELCVDDCDSCMVSRRAPGGGVHEGNASIQIAIQHIRDHSRTGCYRNSMLGVIVEFVDWPLPEESSVRHVAARSFNVVHFSPAGMEVLHGVHVQQPATLKMSKCFLNVVDELLQVRSAVFTPQQIEPKLPEP